VKAHDDLAVAAEASADLDQWQRGLDEVMLSAADSTPDSSDHAGAVAPGSLNASFNCADSSISVIESFLRSRSMRVA
jgi:hypothetical protein